MHARHVLKHELFVEDVVRCEPTDGISQAAVELAVELDASGVGDRRRHTDRTNTLLYVRLSGAAVVAASCLLFVLSADRVARGIAAVVRPVEAMYGEAIIYGQAARLLHGQALYLPLNRPPFTVAAYMPLYYALAAGLRALVRNRTMP